MPNDRAPRISETTAFWTSAACRFYAAPALALILGLAQGVACPAFAQDKEVDLRLSLWVPPAHPLTGAAKAWADDIAKASNGTIKITIFPSEQLGKAFDHYDMARDDIADITYVNPGYQPGRFPIIAIGQMPFTFGDARKGTAALDSWYRKYAPTEMKDTHFCLAFIHDPGALHARKKIVTPRGLARGEGAPGAEHDRRAREAGSAARTSRPRPRRRAKCSSAASPTRSPSPGVRSICSASTRSSNTTSTSRSTRRCSPSR